MSDLKAACETPVGELVKGVADALTRPLAHLRIEGDMEGMSIGTRAVLDEIASRLNSHTDLLSRVERVTRALEEARHYCDENLGPSRSSLLNKIAAVIDEALSTGETKSSPATIDSVPSCGQENDYRRGETKS